MVGGRRSGAGRTAAWAAVAALVVVVVVVAVAAVAAPPAPLPNPPGVRLPRPFAITAAAIELDLDPARPRLTGQARFDGVMNRAEAVIWLHADGLVVSRAVAIPIAGRRRAAPIELEVIGRPDGRLALRAPAPLVAAAAYRVVLDYNAPVADGESAGTFRREEDGRFYAFTQHEPTAARRSFPCLDEPDVKIPWTVTITVPPGMTALANAPEVAARALADGRRQVRFAPTEPLPSYLVAYAVGPFAIVPAGTSAGGAPIRVVVPAGDEAEAGFAAATTGPLLAGLERWLGSPYPFAKLDLLAIPSPDGFTAMEHPGLITVATEVLLVPKGAAADRRRAFTGIAAHELAHLWFGDLVTPVWWDDLWLNESFATWLATMIVGEVAPTLGYPEDAVVGRDRALTADGDPAARSIRTAIADARDIERASSEPIYGKGAAVLRMMAAWTGPERFQRGVRAYLAAHARGNATGADLIAAIDGAADVPDLTRAFTTFLDQPGAPEVTASIDCAAGARPAIRLTQRRWEGEAAPTSVVRVARPRAPAPTRWRIPVCAVVGAGASVTRTCGVLDGDELRLELATCPAWVWPNAGGVGYFRTTMSAAAWAALARDGWRHLDRDERLAAAQDRLAAAGVDGDLDWAALLLAEGRAPATRLAIEPLWAAEMAGAPVTRERVRARLDPWVGARARALGWLPRPADTLADVDDRDGLVELMARLGDPDLGRAAVALSAGWRALPAERARVVMQAAVRADPTVADRLMAELRVEPPHGRPGVLAAAIGVVPDPVRLRAALALLLDDRVRQADAVAVLAAAIHDRDTAPLAASFVVENLDALAARLTKMAWRGVLARALASSCEPTRAAPMRALAEAALGPRADGRGQVERAFARMNRCIATRAAMVPELTRWLGRP